MSIWRRLAVLAGIAAVVLASCGGGGGDPARQYTLRIRTEERGDDYVFVAEDALDLRAGDRVTIELRNAGQLPHDLQVLDPEGTVVGTAATAAPGQTTTVTVDFATPGYYRLNCNVDDHLIVHDMQAIVEVT